MKKSALVLLLTITMLATSALPAAADTTDAAATDTVTATDTTTTRLTIAPSGMTKAAGGQTYIADRTYNVLRLRSKNGSYSVLAGKESVSGYKDGKVAKARFNAPWDVTSYKNGYLISDSENHALRLYKNGRITTIAGNGKAGYKNGTGTKARFNRPTGMATGEDGEVYIADTGNNVIRKIDPNGKVTTYAGGKAGCADGSLTKARFNEPTGLYYYDGALYVADSGNHRICRIKDGVVTTIAGSKKGVEGAAIGKALRASLSNPQDVFVNASGVYISDTGNASIKKLTGKKLSLVVKKFSLGDGRAPAEPAAILVRGNTLLFGDTFNEELYSYDLSE